VKSLREPPLRDKQARDWEPSHSQASPLPTAQDSVDGLIRELARYCAELLFETQNFAKTPRDDS
jgi:hypothetical protein